MSDYGTLLAEMRAKIEAVEKERDDLRLRIAGTLSRDGYRDIGTGTEDWGFAFAASTRCGWCGAKAVGHDREGGAVCRACRGYEPESSSDAECE